MKIDEVASTTKKARVATHTHIKVLYTIFNEHRLFDRLLLIVVVVVLNNSFHHHRVASHHRSILF